MGDDFFDRQYDLFFGRRDPPAWLAPNFDLHMHLDLPRLVWLPTPPDVPPPKLADIPDVGASIEATEQHILDGSFLFSMLRPNWLTLDDAFMRAPLAPPILLPTKDNFKSDFLKYPLSSGLAPVAATPPLHWISYAPPPAPRAGSFGDVLSAIYKLPPVQNLVARANDEALHQVRIAKRSWNDASAGERVLFVSLSALVAGGALGGVLGPGEARHFAFKQMLGMDIPVPFAPGVSFSMTGYGPANQFLLGSRGTDPKGPENLAFSFKVDVFKLVDALSPSKESKP